MMNRLRERQHMLLDAVQSVWGNIVNILLWRVPKYDSWGFRTQAAVIAGSLLWLGWAKKGIIPTVAIGVLAFVAVVMTVRDERIKESHAERIIWILIAFSLLVIEVTVTYKDREDLDNRQAETLREERGSFERMLLQERENFKQEREIFEQGQQALAFLRTFRFNQKQSKDLQNRLSIEQPQSQARAAKTENLPPADLKRRLSELSADIFSFLAARQLPPPTTLSREAMEKYSAAFSAHLDQTMILYEQTFSKKVEVLHEALANKGIRDDELDQYYKDPTNTFGIEILARRLGVIAASLK